MSAPACPHGHEAPETTHVPGTGRTTPMDILWGEHRVIEQVIQVLAAVRDLTISEQVIPIADALTILDLLRTFADTCHHGKEEHLLFPAMERASGGNFQPVNVMRDEHVVGRHHLAAMALACEKANPQSFYEEADGYIKLLRDHIAKEDHCLFGFARQMFNDADNDALLEAFHRVEHEDLGTGVHERMLTTANALADRYGIPKATDDPRVLSLVTAHCGCPIQTAFDPAAVTKDLARLRPMADRVGLVHRLHDPRVSAVTTVVAQLQLHLAAWTAKKGLAPLDRLLAQDLLRGDCRRLAALTDGFVCFADACQTATTLYGGLQALTGDLESALDAEEHSVIAELAKHLAKG